MKTVYFGKGIECIAKSYVRTQPDAPEGFTIMEGPKPSSGEWTAESDGTWGKVAAVSDPTRDFYAAMLEQAYDLGGGRVIQVRPQLTGNPDDSNIRGAIERLERLGLESMLWVMQNNEEHPVTVAELQAALEYGQDQYAANWAAYRLALAGV